MTTPPTDPNENPQPAPPQPGNPWAAPGPRQPDSWAAPAGPPTPPQPKYAHMYAAYADPLEPDPFSVFSTGPGPQHHGRHGDIGRFDAPPPMFPVAPQPSGAGWKLGAVLTVFALVLGGVIFWLATKDDIDFGDDGATRAAVTTTTPTTTTPPKAFAAVGDCVSLQGTRFQPTYEKVDCAADQHNYTVSKLPGRDEKCAGANDNYTLFTSGRARVCLVPIFREGVCYEFGIGVSMQPANPVKPCGAFNIVKARVLKDVVDTAACGQGQALALAYPEIKTTYCFTHTS